MNDHYPHDTSEPDHDRDHVDRTVASDAFFTPADDSAAGPVGADTHAPSDETPPAAPAASKSLSAPTSATTSPAPARGGGPYGVGPFSVREIALLGVWVVAFFVSFFRTNILDSPSGVLVGGGNVWLSGLWWIPAVALPTAAVGLIVLRRLSPQGIRRVGSLGIDQFASVAFTVSALVWVSWVWDTVAVFDETGIWTRSWVIWVEAVVLLAGVVFTVFAPVIPPFSADFRGREEVPAHRNARPIRPVVPRPRTPRAPRPVAAHDAGGADSPVPAPGTYTGSTDLAHDDAAPATSVLPAQRDHDTATDIFAPLHADTGSIPAHDAGHGAEHAAHDDSHDGRAHDERAHDDHAHAQAFWALAPEEREIVDDYGTPIFRIGPTAWALVIEDRGETFVVRHDDGRIGYLHDVSGVTRG
ncbi:hypothetical protein SAMN04487848_1695 [Microbacterium sp. ru370.1]|uniref:hypothetical protein n=1 Tax=unclassified Microbacterium TaxID=2609290 RepID=UPI000888D913|nr:MULTISPECIES: hypothetical protein [unclassified Microbacterium]SDO60968.1 hypothetical protein SAMN04487848_1695 [Microbacterium sp. ru370.1]SIT86373.1 hypothetical protein SAMN05880579_1693 [Microbacterium sp. RU1D]